MKKPLTQKIYFDKVIPGLRTELGMENTMAIPRIMKVVINVGIGKLQRDGAKHVEEVVRSVETITGQKAVLTKARKAIAGFKIREGQEVGVRVTLHGKRMWFFLDRLINIALPRVRDFQGISRSSVDNFGNLNIGMKDHTVFSEIIAEKVQHIFGFQVTVVTTAKDKKEGETLFRFLGVPLEIIEASEPKPQTR